MESCTYSFNHSKQITVTRKQCQDHLRERRIYENKQCKKCHALNHILLCTQKKYLQLKSENYAGQITIWHLKQKNKKLLQKISKNQDRIEISEKIKRNQQNQNIVPNYPRKEMLQTFNPIQLSMIIKQNQKISSAQSTNQQIKSQASFIRSTNLNTQMKQSKNKVKKPFRLQQLKRKAQERLNINRGLSIKSKSSKKQNQRMYKQTGQQFKIY